MKINCRWHLCGLCPEQSSLQIQCNIAVQWVHEWVVCCHWVDKQGHFWQEIFSFVYGLKHVMYLQCSSRDMTNFALHINLRPKISKFCWEVQSIRWQLSLLKSFSFIWLCSIVLWCHLPSQIWNYNPLLT